MRLLRRTPLQVKILVSVMLLVALGVTVSSYLSFRFSNQAAVAAGVTLIRNDLAFRSSAVDFLHEQAQGEIVLAAHMPAFREYFSLPESRAGTKFRDGVLQFTPAQRALKREIDQWVGYFQTKFYTEETCLIDRTGQEHSRLVKGDIAPDGDLSPEEGEQPFFQPSLALKDGEVHIQYPYVSADTHYWVFAYTTPIRLDDGSIPAFYHMELPISRFQEAAIRTELGRAYALDYEKGLILADNKRAIDIERKTEDAPADGHTHSHGGEEDAPRMQDYFPPITEISADPANIKQALDQPYFEFEENGVAYVLLARRLKQFDWVLVTKIDRAALIALGQASESSRYVENIGWILGGAVGVLGTALLLSILLSRAITRPLGALVTATRRIGRGDLNTPVPVLGEDEISEVAGEVDQMRARLSELIEQIRASALEEADEILRNTREGIFLLHPGSGGKIGRRHSRELEKIFETTNFADRCLSDLFRGRVEPRLIADIDGYVDLLFRADMEEEMLQPLNPLNPVDVNVGAAKKSIRMIFSRVMHDDSIERIFVAVRDITADARLAQALAEKERVARRELDLMQDIFKAGPDLLNAFLESADVELNRIGDILRAAQDGATIAVLDALFRSVHTVKGNAALFGLTIAAKIAHAYEEAIIVLRRKTPPGEKVPGEGFLALASLHAELDGVLRESRSVLQKIRDFDRGIEAGASLEAIDLIKLTLSRTTNEAALGAAKIVRIVFKNFTADVVPRDFAPLLSDVLVQMIRNAIAHGIETPELRRAAGKPEAGLIVVEAERPVERDSLKITFRDDGAGFALDAIRQRAVEMGLVGSSIDANTLSHAELLEFMFVPGFSTRNVTHGSDGDLDAGRGVGMDIVRSRIEGAGGSITLDFAPGSYAEIRITLPIGA